MWSCYVKDSLFELLPCSSDGVLGCCCSTVGVAGIQRTIGSHGHSYFLIFSELGWITLLAKILEMDHHRLLISHMLKRTWLISSHFFFRLQICYNFYLLAFQAKRVLCIHPFIHPSVCPSTLPCPHVNLYQFWAGITKFAPNMHHGILSAGIENGGHWPLPSRSFWLRILGNLAYLYMYKQRVLTPGHQGWNDLHSLCRIGMGYYLLNDNNNNNNNDDDNEW